MSIKNSNIKKYCIILLVTLGVVFLFLYFYKWYEVKKDEKYLESYLINTNTINLEMNEIDEIHSVLSETANYYFVYVSYTEDKEIYEFEKTLKPLIDEYDLQNNFYYINVTDIKETNKDYKKEIAKELNVKESDVSKIPSILYFKDNNLEKSGISTAKDFEDLLIKENVKTK